MMKTSRPLIMGILNITPDSFSDGQDFLDPERAVNHALRMVEEGADFIDVGAESTRPGSTRVAATEQIRRLIDVFDALQELLPGTIQTSIDTTLSAVAEVALDRGASLVNDISAGRDDPDMFSLCAEREVYLALMHMQGEPETMQNNPVYSDVVAEVIEFLRARVQAANEAGIHKNKLLVDPGIGFGKSSEHNLSILAHLKRVVTLGYPVLLGTSRKRFMGNLLNEAEPKNLVAATCSTTALAVQSGVKVFRVHDVAENRQAADTAYAIKLKSN